MSGVVDRKPRPPRPSRVLGPADSGPGQVFEDEAVHVGLLLSEAECAGAVAAQVELKGFRLEDVDLGRAALDQLQMEDGSVLRCDLANLKSERLVVRRVEFSACRLTGATLAEPRLEDVVFSDCRMDLASFRFGRLRRVRFEGCRLTEADFQGVTASACTFVDCDLTRAQLSQGKFAGSAFRGCRLEGLRGLEALRGTAVASGDLAELADAFAVSLAIDVRDDID
jgi:uncharacterized protein YjbI with pentapeptide repeats